MRTVQLRALLPTGGGLRILRNSPNSFLHALYLLRGFGERLMLLLLANFPQFVGLLLKVFWKWRHLAISFLLTPSVSCSTVAVKVSFRHGRSTVK